MLGLCLTQWFGVDGRRTFVAFQAMTPLDLIWAAPIALVACIGRRHALAITALVPLTTLMVLSYPIIFHADPAPVAADAPRLSITFANLLFYNQTPDDAAARTIASDADVLLLVEVTPPLHDAMVAAAAAADADYPYHVGTSSGGSEAIELWRRHRIISGSLVEIDNRRAIDVVGAIHDDRERWVERIEFVNKRRCAVVGERITASPHSN